MTESSPRIVVVGAGVAGFAAAHRLQRSGASVVVLEARPWIGGRTRTDEVDGFRVDAGVQLFGSMYREFLRLLREAGGGDLLVRAPGRDALWRDGRIHEVVYGSVTSMLASGALPFRTKMRMGTVYLPFLTRHADALDIRTPERAADAGLDGESIAAWGERELGRDFVEYLAYPLLAAYFGVTPEETGAPLYHMLARGGMNVEVFALRGGASGFCETLAAQLRRGGGEVRTETRVARVEPEAGGVRISGEGWTEEYDGAVLALGAPSTRALLAGSAPGLEAWLEGVRFRSTVSLALLLDRPVGAPYFGLSLPRGEFRVLSSVCVEENKSAGLVPEGRGLLVAFPTPEAGVRFLDRDPQRVVDAALPELERVFPGVERSVQRAKVYRWPEWNAVFGPGFLRHLRTFRSGAVEGEGPVALAGDFLHAPGVEGAVISGEGAAERLLHRLPNRESING